jgi:hypothetical protein
MFEGAAIDVAGLAEAGVGDPTGVTAPGYNKAQLQSSAVNLGTGRLVACFRMRLNAQGVASPRNQVL